MSAEKKIHCVVVTPERTILDEEANFVALPVHDGELGVLPGRAPLVARLGPGELRLKSEDGKQEQVFVDGGFVQVRQNVVTVLTARSEAVHELDLDTLVRELEEINAEVPSSELALDFKAGRLLSTRAQIRLASKSNSART